MDPATAAMGIGLGAVDNLTSLAFGPMHNAQQQKAQRIALRQQNEAAMDIWNKTSYPAQMEKMKEAGLNPALMYGMGGAAGGTVGGSNAMPEQMKSKGMDIAGAAQLELLKAQAENIRADTKNKLRGAGEGTAGETDLSKVRQDTKTGAAQEKNLGANTALTNVNAKIAEVTKDIAEYGQWYEMGKVEASWKKVIAEAESAIAKGTVDRVTVETHIQQERENLAMTVLQQKAVKKGMQVSDAQIQSLQGLMRAALQNADSMKWGAESGARGQNTAENRLRWEQHMKNVPDDLKLLTETIQDIAQALALKGIMAKPPRTEVEGFKQKY